MALPVQFGDIVRFVELTAKLWQKTFSEHYQIESLYGEFFRSVRAWNNHVTNLRRVIDNARSQRGTVAQYDEDVFDGRSLAEIVGNYYDTLKECDTVLDKAKSSAARSGGTGGLTTLHFNLKVKPEIDRLTARIDVFNSKLLFLLKPLEIDLLQRISRQLDAVHEIVSQIRGIVIGDISPQAVRLGQSVRFLAVPANIGTVFEERARINWPGESNSEHFPLTDGTDALVRHFSRSTRSFVPAIDAFADERTPSSMQYLSLLKSVWIINKLEYHPALSRSPPQSHWPSFIKNMSVEISKQCARFLPETGGDLLQPELEDHVEEDFDIWEPPIEVPIVPVIDESIGMMEEVLHVPMARPRPNVDLTMRVLRGPGGRYKLMFTAREPTRAGMRVEQSNMEFSTKTVRLIPLYAHPTEHTQHRLKLVLQSEFAVTDLVFERLTHLLQFQQAVTGFKAYSGYSYGPVDVVLVSATQPKPQGGKAFLQLWIPKELKGSPVSMDSIREESRQQDRRPPEAPLSPRAPRRSETSETMFGIVSEFPPSMSTSRSIAGARPKPPDRRDSAVIQTAMSPPPSASRNSFFSSKTFRRRSSTQNSTLCVPETSANGSKRHSFSKSSGSSGSIHSSYAPTVTLVDHGTGPHGLLHTKPRRPMLVLYLQTIDATGVPELSFLAIQIDEETGPNAARCSGCQKNQKCPIIAFERDEGEKNLLATPFPATELREWDITRLGIEKRKDLPSSKQKNSSKLQRVTFRFHDDAGSNKAGPDLRREFGGVHCQCENRTLGQLYACLEHEHQGLYGWVKEIGRKAMADWNNVQNQAVEVITGYRSLPPGY